MVRVHFSKNLVRHLPALTECHVKAETMAEAMEQLEFRFPGLSAYVLHENGALRPHVNIYLGERFLKDREGLGDPLQDVEHVFVMQALSGG